VFVHAYKSIAFANNVVGRAIFTIRYLGHASEKAERNTALHGVSPNLVVFLTGYESGY